MASHSVCCSFNDHSPPTAFLKAAVLGVVTDFFGERIPQNHYSVSEEVIA